MMRPSKPWSRPCSARSSTDDAREAVIALKCGGPTAMGKPRFGHATAQSIMQRRSGGRGIRPVCRCCV